jgi:predicted PurR-regulated permease PerM
MDGGDPAPLTGSETPAPERIPESPPGRGLRTLAWLKSFARVWGFLLFCVLVVYAFRAVALPFVFAVLVAYILAPLVDRMSRLRVAGRPFPRGLSVVIIYINLIALLGVFLGYFIPKLSGDFARLFREMPQLFEKLNDDYLPRAGAWIDRNLGAQDEASPPPPVQVEPAPPQGLVMERLPDGKWRVDLSGVALEVQPGRGGRYLIVPPQPEPAEAGGEGKWERSIKQWIKARVRGTELETKRAIQYGQKFVTGVITGVARLVLVLMVAAFILIDLERVRGFIRSLFPASHRDDYDRIARGIDRGLSGVIRGQLVICLINGILTYVGLWLFKVKYSLLLAGIAAVMSLIPIFGSILSSVPIVAVALISSGSFDLAPGLYILGWIIAIHLLEANYLNPRIMGEAAKIHPVLVVFALIAGEQSYGLVGALFAVPVASIIQTIFVYYRRRGFARSPAPP